MMFRKGIVLLGLVSVLCFGFSETYRIDIENAPMKGPADARITMIAFLNFACSHCSDGLRAANRIQAAYPDRIRLVFKYWLYPSDSHSVITASAAMAAFRQGMFWEMSEILMENQDRFDSEFLDETALALGFDMERFRRDAEPAQWIAYLKKDLDDGLLGGVSGSPTFFVNGHKVEGGDYGNLEIAVETLLRKM